jgi:hypothetical protein
MSSGGQKIRMQPESALNVYITCVKKVASGIFTLLWITNSQFAQLTIYRNQLCNLPETLEYVLRKLNQSRFSECGKGIFWWNDISAIPYATTLSHTEQQNTQSPCNFSCFSADWPDSFEMIVIFSIGI